MIPVVRILGVPFSRLNMSETVQLIFEWMGQDRPRQVVTANPEIVMYAKDHEKMAEVLEGADLITPDGIGAVLAARIQGVKIGERVTGADMLPMLFEKLSLIDGSVYLLGASPEANQKALENLRLRYPSIQFSGHHGYFKENQVGDIRELIRSAAPQLLLVGLNMGRQELFIHTYKNELQVPVSIGIGGCIDIFAGTVKRAPVFFQRIQCEWLYRLLSQPSRWRRQLVLPKFAWTVLKERFLSR